MIRVLVGDIFESKAHTLVNTVNCVGVMGKGIALEFKKRFPDMYEDYVLRCKRGVVRLGEPYVYFRHEIPWILNFPTKYHWRALANSEDIIRGLEYLLNNYKSWGIKSIAIPPLGAGLGQLEWRIIGPILYSFLSKMEIPVELYAPYQTPADELQLDFLRTGVQPNQLALKMPSPEWITAPWIALVEILRHVQSQPYHWPIGSLPLDIEFKRGSFGPFSPSLKRMTSRLIGNGLIIEQQSDQMFEIKVGQQFDNAIRAYATELVQWESIISKVADLFARTTTHQAEVIATVLYAARELGANSSRRIGEAEIVSAVLDWKLRRRPPLSPTEVAYTVRNLAALKWLDLKPDAAEILPYEAPVEL